MAAIVTLTGSQFDALPYEDGRRWELLDGELIPVLLALMIISGRIPGRALR